MKAPLSILMLATALALAPSASANGEDEDADDECGDLGLALESFQFATANATFDDAEDLAGNVSAGDEVTVEFGLVGCGMQVVTLVTHEADAELEAETDVETIFALDTAAFANGTFELSVTLPTCDIAIEFVFGSVVEVTGQAGETSYEVDGEVVATVDLSIGCGEPPAPTPTPTPPAPPTPPSPPVMPPPTPPTTPPTPPTTPPTPPPDGEVPFFPGSSALALGLIGALGGAAIVLRRKK